MARTIGGSSSSPSSRSASASLLLASSSSRAAGLLGIIPGFGHYHHGCSSSSAMIIQGPFSLPLLEGLSHRNRSAAVAVVEEAFQQWNATKVLSRTFDGCHGKKIQRPRPTTTSSRRKRRGKTSPAKNATSFGRTAANKNSSSGGGASAAAAAFAGTTVSIDRSHDKENQPRQQKQQYYHWLFQGLQSSSLPERRVACKILSQGLCVSGDPNFIWQVLELIVDLLKVDYTNTTLIALLKHLLTEVVDAKTQLAFSINQSMGIPWICQLIYSIVSSSTTASSSAAGGGGGTIPNNHARGGDDENNRVLMPLLDLLYHLVMIDRSSKYLHQAHLVLWNKKQQQQQGSKFDDSSPRNNPSSSSSPSKALFQDNDPHHHHHHHHSSKTLVLSPLGCLIAAKHYVSDHHHNKTVLSLLLPLVDPESVPKLLPPKLSETSKDDCYLIDTFTDTTTKPGSGGTSGANKSSAEGAGGPASSSTAAGAASSLAELRAAVGADGGGGTTSATANAAASSTSSPSAAAAAQAAAASLESALPGAASTVAQLFSAVYLGGGGSGADGSSPGGDGGHLLEDHDMEDADDHHHFDDVEDEHHHDDDEDDDDDEDQNHDDDDHDEDDEEEQHDHVHDEDDDDDEDGQHQDADEDMDEDGDNNKKNKSNNAGGNSSNRMDIDQDEEIDSEDGDDVDVKDHDEDDDDDDDEDDDDDDDDDDDEEDDEEDEDHSGIVIHDEDVARLEQGLLELNELDAVRGATGGNSSSAATSAAAAAIAARLGQNPGSLSALAGGAASSLAAGLSGVTDPASDHPQTVQERKEIYIKACMQVINAQHPQGVKHPSPPPSPPPSKAATKSAPASIVSAVSPPTSMLSLKSEHALMTSILNIVQPPKKPVNLKFILRRAPTQEEFFRGSLSKNPVTLSMLKSSQGQEEPTVRDLRQHIATDLQMADSAEMLELLVTNKILDVDLKLRVVHQVTWKDHLIQNAPPSGSAAANAASSALSSFLGGRGGARSFISTGSGLSMIFNSGLDRSLIAAGGGPITSDTPLSALPPMIVTYRLTGVDGEATEDTITTLEDPEAPSETASPEQVEAMMEKKFGVTRLVTGGRGVLVLLRSVDRHVSDVLRQIRRDSIGRGGGRNPSRDQFKEASPCSALTLLTCCSKLASNRKLLLETRAPTILLRLLLDVLHSLEEQQQFGGNKKSESNATAQSLQELIEVLASDMLSSSTTQGTSAAVVASPSSPASDDSDENDTEQDTSTLRLLIQGIETSSLSRPLRNVIAKLLPYLTYGQAPLAKELAFEFVRHVQVDRLGDCENEDDLLEQVTGGRRYILMATFVHASISLRPNEVCNSLRKELIGCGFVQGIANFLLRGVPTEPPTWTASLWLKGEQQKINGNSKRKEQLEREWREYTQRRGLKIAFDILIGLSKQHGPTQEALGKYVAGNKVSLIRACHWLEATSDNTSARVSLNGLGLVAETLLDELATDASPVVSQVKTCRRKTRDRKKEIAMERRSKALVSMSSFGPLAGAATLGDAGNKSSSSSPAAAAASGTTGGSVRSTMASIVAPVWDLFQGSSSSQSGNNDSPTSPPPAKRRRRNQQSPAPPTKKPAWMVEMENMEDETGLTCCVCQEGRTLQPSEILGLYAHVKKITVPLSQGGGRNNIDGTTLLVSLPSTVPASIAGTHAGNVWFPSAMGARTDLSSSSRSNLSSSVASSRRATYFTTTVAAGNAIHFSCHTKARQADRNHPKAPKSEWEGASLRNSRVQCNVILPLVSSRSSKVPLVAVDVALTDHQTAVSNLLGARPKSMLWTVLHDVRFLLLRMAYGEALNADCGGGSLLSNAQLVYYQLLMADMFEKDAQLDAPDTSQHARGLSAGFLAACSIIKASGGGTAASENNAMLRGISDAAPMASLTGVIFFNNKDDSSRSSANKASSSSSSDDNDDGAPHPKRRWVVGRENFLRGLLNCTGRRHALGVTNSGCLTGRTAGNKRSRSGSAFADWDIVDEEDILMDIGGSGSTTSALSPERAAALKRSTSSSNKVGIDDFRDALRPMIVYFAMMDQISTDFVLNMDDTKVEENAANLVQVIEDCRRCKNMKDLLNKAKVTLSEDEIIDELQRGMMSA